MQGWFGHGSPILLGLAVHLVKLFRGRESEAGRRAAPVRGGCSSFPEVCLDSFSPGATRGRVGVAVFPSR
jgi:hypothetical protein